MVNRTPRSCFDADQFGSASSGSGRFASGSRAPPALLDVVAVAQLLEIGDGHAVDTGGVGLGVGVNQRGSRGRSEQVLQAARQADWGTEVVVITGHHADMEAKPGQVLSQGARAVLPKPLDVAALLALLQRLTSKQRD